MENLFLPEWAPNIHPMLVHFPIALFMVAIFMDLAGYILPKEWWDEKKNLILYGLSGLAAVVTFFSGKQAADSVFIEAETQNLLTAHADWAEYTVWFIGLYALLRIGLYVWVKSEMPILKIGMTLVSFIGAFLLFQTGDRGAQMVYQYGVGVQAIDLENPIQHDHEVDHDESGEAMDEDSESEENGHNEGTEEQGTNESSANGATSFNVMDNGNWEWEIDENAVSDLNNNFHWLTGSLNEANAQVVSTANGGYALSISGENLTGFFVGHDESYIKTQVDYYIDITELEGTVWLTSNVQDQTNFDFVSIASNGEIKQGRIAAGEEEVFEKGTADVSKTLFVRVVANGDHFRGYIDKEMIVHGHADAPKAGAVGVKVDGSGTVKLEKMILTKL